MRPKNPCLEGGGAVLGRSFLVPLIAALLVLLVVHVAPAAAAGGRLEQAVLAGDWAKVAAILKKDDAKAKDPVARLLMGHASLALNRGNDAFLLFRSVSAAEDLAAWKAWTQAIAKNEPANPRALYLRADAAARSGDLKAAIDEFSRAIEADPGFALALNARGVARVAVGDPDPALNDFVAATYLDPPLADAHASYGAYTVLQAWPPAEGEGGFRAFEEALRLDPKLALAYNGRGCLQFGRGKFREAAADFEKAVVLLPSLGIPVANKGFAEAYDTRRITLAGLGAQPGMALQSESRQRDELVRSEDRALQKLIPDNAIRDKILVYPHLPPAEQRRLVDKVGKELIIRVHAVELHKADAEMWRLHQEQLQLNRDIRAETRLARKLAVFEGIASAFNTVRSAIKGDPVGVASEAVRSPWVDALDIATSAGNSVDLGLFTASKAVQIGQAVQGNNLDRLEGRSKLVYQQFNDRALSALRSSITLDQLGAGWKPPQAPAPSPAPTSIVSWVASSVPLSRLSNPPRSIANGVTTEAIGHAFVDRGDWPVMTTFTLGYRPVGGSAGG